jgi:hypothetical protein
MALNGAEKTLSLLSHETNDQWAVNSQVSLQPGQLFLTVTNCFEQLADGFVTLCGGKVDFDPTHVAPTAVARIRPMRFLNSCCWYRLDC